MQCYQEIMPLVWAKRPGARVFIVGANPPRSIRRLAQIFPGRVEVTGAVPDIRPYLRRAAVAAAPVRYGAGIQNKVLEAMACGVPVVATSQACSALEAVSDRDLLVAATAGDFAAGVVRVLEDGALAGRLGAAGRRYVEAHHDWGVVTGQLEHIYEECILEQKNSPQSTERILPQRTQRSQSNQEQSLEFSATSAVSAAKQSEFSAFSAISAVKSSVSGL